MSFVRLPLLICLGLLLAAPLGALAQSRGQDETVSLRGGVGFTADPGAFLLGIDVPFRISENVAMGPSMQLGLDDDSTFFAPTWSGEFRLPIENTNAVPYFHAGLGAAYLEKERRRRRDKDDVGFLIAFGLGGDFFVSDEFALGSRVTFNVMPDDVVDEHFIFSWQVVTGRFSF